MNHKILIVDREPEVLEDLEFLLVSAGYEVSKTSRSEDVLSIIGTGIYHLVIMDIRIPEMNGLELIKQIKQLDNELEVIVLTGFVSLENAVKALRDCAASDFIMKPLKDTNVLINSIENAMEKQKKRKREKENVLKLQKENEALRIRIMVLGDKLSNNRMEVAKNYLQGIHNII